MKGIILAGGSGTRLYPITRSVCKQLIPIYDKPMVYYSLSTLMLSGINEVLIISTPEDIGRFETLFGDGSSLGMKIAYAVQEKPNGLAEALIIGGDFLDGDNCCLVLGDNIFYGHGLPELLQEARQGIEKNGGARIFGFQVGDPERFGVVEFDKNQKVLSLEEKPSEPKSDFAAVGLYFYDSRASAMAHAVEPSARGEKEITALNCAYLEKEQLRVSLLGRGFAWFDTGTFASLNQATNFVQMTQANTGTHIANIEEIAFRMGFIDKKQLLELAEPLVKSGYGTYLLKVAKEGRLYS